MGEDLRPLDLPLSDHDLRIIDERINNSRASMFDAIILRKEIARLKQETIPRSWWNKLKALLNTKADCYLEERRWAFGEVIEQMEKIEEEEK